MSGGTPGANGIQAVRKGAALQVRLMGVDLYGPFNRAVRRVVSGVALDQRSRAGGSAAVPAAHGEFRHGRGAGRAFVVECKPRRVAAQACPAVIHLLRNVSLVGDGDGLAVQRGAEGGPLPRRPADLLYALRPFLSKRPDCRAVRRFAGRGQLVRGILGPVVSKHLFIPALKKEPPLSGMRRPPSGGKLSSRRTAILRPPSCSGSLSTSDRLIIHRLAPVDNTDFSRRTPS